MSVPIETSRSSYAPGGVTTVFSTGFYFLDETEVVVKLTPSGGVETIGVLGVNYTITMPASVGAAGSVVMTVAPAAGSALVIEREVPITQATSFRTAGTFSRAVHEDAMDEVVFQNQQLARRVSDLESAGAPGSVIAGDGLSFSGTTLHAGAGNGVQVNPDTIEVLYGASGDLAESYAGGGEYDGVLNRAARADHGHNIITATPGAILIGDVSTEGGGSALARASHTHALDAPAAPADVTKAAAAAGASTAPARADHKHNVSTAAAVSLTDASNAEGGATSLARSDHTHSHGARGGGTLHANATNLVAGFMSAADKTNMENIGTVALKSRVAASSTAPQSIATATGTPFTGYTETTDSDNEFNPATGVYTAKAAGNLLVLAQAFSASAAWPLGALITLSIRKNGSGVGADYRFFDAAVTRLAVAELTRFFPVALGDTVDLFITHNQGGNVNFSAGLSVVRFV